MERVSHKNETLKNSVKGFRDQGKEDEEVRGDEPNKGGLYYDQYNLTKSKLTTAFSVLLQRARSLPQRPLASTLSPFCRTAGPFSSLSDNHWN